MTAYPDTPAGWAERRERGFRRMMDLVFAAHPYYRRRLADLGLARGDFRSVADIERIPPIDKDAYMAEPEAFVLDLEGRQDVTPEESTRWRVIYTTGTTQKPTPFYDTTHDHFSRVNQMTLATRIAGIGEDDVVLNLFPLTPVPHQGFLSATYGPMGVGAKLIAALGGKPYADFPVHRGLDEILDLAVRQRPTVLWGVTTYVRRVIVRAEERGDDLASVRTVFAMGEACPPGMREDMRARLGRLGARSARILGGYGFTEMQGPTMECAEGSGFHVPTPGEYHFEILDPDSGRPLPEGKRGLVTISHLNRRGTVLLRYSTGDVSAFSSEPCPACGRLEPRFTVSPYRLSGLTKVKGTLINPATLEEELSRVPRLKEYQIVVAKEGGDAYGMDEMIVHVVCDPPDFDEVAREVTRRARAACEITPRVVPASSEMVDQLARGYKHRRFVDARPA